jgi:hypothetical protein
MVRAMTRGEVTAASATILLRQFIASDDPIEGDSPSLVNTHWVIAATSPGLAIHLDHVTSLEWLPWAASSVNC